jgi:hypothetical protein
MENPPVERLSLSNVLLSFQDWRLFVHDLPLNFSVLEEEKICGV